MDTCVRGFSFMPEVKVEVSDLQYIEGGELERNWKATRRERLREREQRIWKEFVVNEQDVLQTFCKDDPYQFLEQLPQNQIEELLEIELQNMRLEKEKEDTDIITASSQVDADSQEVVDVQHLVTFADEDEKEDCDMFHIFDDDKDDEISGPEDDALNDSMGSPDTVRERSPDLSPTALPNSPDKTSSKSSENMNNVIERSIYCAKVKDLRLKLNEELVAIIAFLENRDVMDIDPEDMVKMRRQSTEFSARFNRNHLYQLQRQIHDVKRNNSLSLPFAKHTQFQSQMVRITSLHQNMLQSLQVFQKWLCRSWFVLESVSLVSALLDVCREASIACSDAPAPENIAKDIDLYEDNLLATCDNLQVTIDEYATKLSNYIQNTENTNQEASSLLVELVQHAIPEVTVGRRLVDNNPNSKGSSKLNKGRIRSLGTWSKSGSKLVEADARLSMYSIDTLRWNGNVKPTSSKDGRSSGTSKMGGDSSRGRATNQDSGRQPKICRKKSPRSRRPLMRGPQLGKFPGIKRKLPRDTDIQTMVQAVDIDTCTSSRISQYVIPDSPIRRKDVTPHRKSKETTPRKALGNTPGRSQATTPREPLRLNLKNPKINPKSPKDFSKIKDSLLSNSGNKIIPKTPKSLTNEFSEIQDHLINSSVKKGEIDSGNNITDKITMESVKERNMDNIEVLQKEKIQGEYSEIMEQEKVKVDKEKKSDKERNKAANPTRCEVTRILRQLCEGNAPGSRSDSSSVAKNVQLLCVNSVSPRQPSTPQLLRILEETIQKKPPKPMFEKPTSHKDMERYRLVFNVPEKTTEKMFQYRTKFLQHMITSPMYANSAIEKPWEVIGRISEHIIDDLLLSCAKQMELPEVVQKLYDQETR